MACMFLDWVFGRIEWAGGVYHGTPLAPRGPDGVCRVWAKDRPSLTGIDGRLDRLDDDRGRLCCTNWYLTADEGIRNAAHLFY